MRCIQSHTAWPYSFAQPQHLDRLNGEAREGSLIKSIIKQGDYSDGQNKWPLSESLMKSGKESGKVVSICLRNEALTSLRGQLKWMAVQWMAVSLGDCARERTLAGQVK